MVTSVYKPKDPYKNGEWSLPFEVNRIDYERMLDPDISHLNSKDKIQRLDLFWMLDLLHRKLGKQYGESELGKGYFISRTWKTENKKFYRPLGEDRIRKRMSELFKRHGFTMNKNAEEGGETEPKHASKIKVSGHYIRGHVESVCFCLANDPSVDVSFPANAMIDNAGHKEATFHQSYSRPILPRQSTTAKKHRNIKTLSKEEVQLT